jgi:hypothetical protein
MHFMELKRFIIDDAVDFSHLFYLRGLRGQSGGEQELDQSLSKWMEGTAVKLLADTVVKLMATASPAYTLREFYPGVGLTGEYVKLLLHRRTRQAADAGPTLTAYQGCGPASERNKLIVLHADEPCPTTYVDEVDAAAILDDVPDTVMVFNHNQSVRYDQPPRVSLESFLARRRGPALIAVRATAGAADEAHMSVKGRLVELPSVRRVLDLCRSSGGAWFSCFLEGFDAGFFLPDGTGPTGLLVACCGARSEMSGFEAVV